MTQAQWLFEARALQEKEEQRAKLISDVMTASLKNLKDLLIVLFGLHIGAKKYSKEEEKDLGLPYLPFNMFVARPEVMKEMIERDEEEAARIEAGSDSDLDALNEDLSQLDLGDLEPILEGGDFFDQWTSDEHLHHLEEIGVDLHEGPLFDEDEIE